MSGMNAGYKIRRRGRGTIAKKMVLQPRPGPSMCEISLTQELLAVCFALLSIQFKPLSLDILLGGELGAISVNVGDYPSVGELDESVVDKVAVD